MKISKDWKTGGRNFQGLENGVRRGGGRAPGIAFKTGFTLIELLTVLAIIAVLGALLSPMLAHVHAAAQESRCAGNLRQLHAANVLYAADHGSFVAAAPDIFGGSGGLVRWHGVRESESQPFDAARGPLVPYLGADACIRECPAFRRYADGFEAGCGGYGYNGDGVGSRAYYGGYNPGNVTQGMPPSGIRQPANTVMFCDTARPATSDGKTCLIEYSFVEAYRHLNEKQPTLGKRAQPSIHFRHSGHANVVWCDGHVSAETMTPALSDGAFAAMDIGWFGGADNTLFDPY